MGGNGSDTIQVSRQGGVLGVISPKWDHCICLAGIVHVLRYQLGGGGGKPSDNP